MDRELFSCVTAYRLWVEGTRGLADSKVPTICTSTGRLYNTNDVKVALDLKDNHKPSWLPEVPEPFASFVAKKLAEKSKIDVSDFSDTERTGTFGTKGPRITVNDVRRKLKKRIDSSSKSARKYKD